MNIIKAMIIPTMFIIFLQLFFDFHEIRMNKKRQEKEKKNEQA